MFFRPLILTTSDSNPQKRCNGGGFGNVDAFTGHGIGAEFHTYPSIYHFGDHFEGRDDVGVTMQPGMVFTIEPIIVHLNARGRAPTFRTLSDAWTIIANEPLLSAQVWYCARNCWAIEHGVGIRNR
jgi:Xaa-Pro aminopeptidase